jgi:hypothetical protein
LLGHAKLDTTALYTRVATKTADKFAVSKAKDATEWCESV